MYTYNNNICQLQQILRELQSNSLTTRREGRERLFDLLENDIFKMCAYWLRRQSVNFHYFDYPVSQELDDVLQTVWLVVFEKITSFKDVENDDVENRLRRWIRTIVWRTVASHLRCDIRKKYDCSLEAERDGQTSLSETFAASDNDILEEISDKLLHDSLIKTFKSVVNPQEWDALYGHAVEERSFEEMAKTLHEKSATVRKRKQYAVNKLSSYFKELE